jgi:sugar/nucleoside kinase (ribokinase family)
VSGTRPRQDASASDAPSAGFDVFLAGLLFFDIVFTGLQAPPEPGAEIGAAGMGSGPGGIANLAVALARLDLNTAMAAAFGDDAYGAYLWNVLESQEGVDLSRSRRFPGWHSLVTVSLAYDGDRAMVTHAHEPPLTADELVGTPPPSRAAVVDLGPRRQGWLEQAHAAGTLVFADAGFDEAAAHPDAVLDQLPLCHAFMPNAAEAMAYTRTGTPEAALAKLADLVPIAVITRGGDGVLAADATTGESAAIGGLGVSAFDTTGAGDVFGAGFVAGTLAGWPLLDRLRFANLGAALAVQQFGGALAAPGWAGVARWWRAVRAGRHPRAAELRADYAFLDEVIPPGVGPEAPVHHAQATIGFTRR